MEHEPHPRTTGSESCSLRGRTQHSEPFSHVLRVPPLGLELSSLPAQRPGRGRAPGDRLLCLYGRMGTPMKTRATSRSPCRRPVTSGCRERVCPDRRVCAAALGLGAAPSSGASAPLRGRPLGAGGDRGRRLSARGLDGFCVWTWLRARQPQKMGISGSAGHRVSGVTKDTFGFHVSRPWAPRKATH